MKVLRKLGCCLKIKVGIVWSLNRNARHQVILPGKVPEIAEQVVVGYIQFMMSSVTTATP